MVWDDRPTAVPAPGGCAQSFRRRGSAHRFCRHVWEDGATATVNALGGWAQSVRCHRVGGSAHCCVCSTRSQSFHRHGPDVDPNGSLASVLEGRPAASMAMVGEGRPNSLGHARVGPRLRSHGLGGSAHDFPRPGLGKPAQCFRRHALGDSAHRCACSGRMFPEPTAGRIGQRWAQSFHRRGSVAIVWEDRPTAVTALGGWARSFRRHGLSAPLCLLREDGPRASVAMVSAHCCDRSGRMGPELPSPWSQRTAVPAPGGWAQSFCGRVSAPWSGRVGPPVPWPWSGRVSPRLRSHGLGGSAHDFPRPGLGKPAQCFRRHALGDSAHRCACSRRMFPEPTAGRIGQRWAQSFRRRRSVAIVWEDRPKMGPKLPSPKVRRHRLGGSAHCCACSGWMGPELQRDRPNGLRY